MTKNEYIDKHGEDAYRKYLENIKRWKRNNKDEIKEYNKRYRSTPLGRATNLVGAYKQLDKRYNRGECTLTPQWIVENIFTSKCIYCGESDWQKLGVDRINNDLPHTEDNVNPCCGRCNSERHTKEFEIFLKQKRKQNDTN